jgi:hypothetical protein
MEKKFFLLGVAVLLSASLFFLGCPTDDDGGTDDPVKSDKAEVAGSVTVKGQTVALGTETGTFADPIKGAVTLDVDGDAVFAYTKPEGATAKAVLSTDNALTEAAFGTATAFADGAISGGTSYLYLKVTAEDGETVKWYKITVTVTNVVVDNNGGFSIEKISGQTSPAVSIDSVLQNFTTKEFTIKLAGAYPANVEGGVQYLFHANGDDQNTTWQVDNWASDIGTPKAGKYGDITIEGLYSDSVLALVAVKNTSPGLLYYEGVDSTAMANLPAAADDNDHSTYYPTGDAPPVRWQFKENVAVGKTLTVLLYDGGSTVNLAKSLKLEIVEYNVAEGGNAATVKDGGYKLTATIDYSGVTFPDAPPPAAPTSSSLL